MSKLGPVNGVDIGIKPKLDPALLRGVSRCGLAVRR